MQYYSMTQSCIAHAQIITPQGILALQASDMSTWLDSKLLKALPA